MIYQIQIKLSQIIFDAVAKRALDTHVVQKVQRQHRSVRVLVHSLPQTKLISKHEKMSSKKGKKPSKTENASSRVVPDGPLKCRWAAQSEEKSPHTVIKRERPPILDNVLQVKNHCNLKMKKTCMIIYH